MRTHMTPNEEFDPNLNNLRTDINAIDLMLSSIQRHITVLESQLSAIQHILKNPNTPSGDKAKLYAGLNNAQELLSRYYDNYNRYLETKYKYRKEQNELGYKLIKLEIDSNDPTLKNNNELSEMLKVLSNNKLTNLDDDPLYTI